MLRRKDKPIRTTAEAIESATVVIKDGILHTAPEAESCGRRRENSGILYEKMPASQLVGKQQAPAS